MPEDGSLDMVIKPQKGAPAARGAGGAASEKARKLDEKDEVWERYKNMHIAEVLGALNDEIRLLKEDQAQLKKYAGKEEIHHDEI